MAMQSLFARAVSANLPSAIPTTLERIDQFAIGKVLTYQKKPYKLLPWRRRELNFTGRSITDLLAKGQLQELKFATSSDFLFDAGKGTDRISVEVGLDGELKSALSQIDLDLQEKEQKCLSISTDFGKITHVQTDLFEVLHAHRIRVNTDHPVVREARKNGDTLFVIVTLFEAERCNVRISFSEKRDDSAKVQASAPQLGATAGGSVDDSTASVKVANRDQPTVLAYLLLRMTINSNNELVPKLNNRLDQGSNATRVDMIDGPLKQPAGGSGKLTVPKINPADSVVGKWVMVDMVQEWKPEDSVEVGTETHNQQSPMTSLGVPSLNQHYVYSLKDFQCFCSNTYAGIVDESQRWVRPILANKRLREAFLQYVEPPNSHQKLRVLSQCLQDWGSALRTGSSEAPPTVFPALEPIHSAMSTEPGYKLKENTSLLVISEACLEFPQHVMKMVFELQQDKRELLLSIIKCTPNGVGRHVFMDDKPFDDPALHPIMRHMGFSVPEQRLVYTTPDNVEDDMLAAGIIVILFSE